MLIPLITHVGVVFVQYMSAAPTELLTLHCLVALPIRLNPALHSNRITLWNATSGGLTIVPFPGAVKVLQSEIGICVKFLLMMFFQLS